MILCKQHQIAAILGKNQSIILNFRIIVKLKDLSLDKTYLIGLIHIILDYIRPILPLLRSIDVFISIIGPCCEGFIRFYFCYLRESKHLLVWFAIGKELTSNVFLCERNLICIWVCWKA